MSQPNISTKWQVANAANELTGILHGTSLNQIFDLTDVWNRAARRVLQDVDPMETKQDIPFGQIWDGVYDYALPVDVKGDKIIDLYPQANRQLSDDYGQVYNKDFDKWKNFSYVPDFTPRYSGGNRTLRVNARLNTGIQINAADGITTNGTWAVGGNASNIQNNNQYFTNGAAGSVTFQLNQTGISSTGSITNSTMGDTDLTNHYNNAYEFFYMYFPNAAGITSVEFRFGSSAGNYYSIAGLTTDYAGNAWVNGWNLLGASWTTATTVGTPDITDINYISVIVTYNGTLQTMVGINQVWSRLGRIFNINYYSKYLFMDSVTYAFKEFTTSDQDYINLDTDARDMFLFAAALEAIQQQQGLSAAFYDDPTLLGKYNDAIASYTSKYKSEITKPRKPYYTLPQAGYRRNIGRRNY